MNSEIAEKRMTTRAEKRRKVVDGGLRLLTSPLVKIVTAEDDGLSSDQVTVSCCSSNRSINVKESVESGSGLPEMIIAKQVTLRRTVSPEKMPPAAEIEEFFASVEKDLHKSFKDKYNYDIVNDMTLEGRFEWVELKQ